MATIAVPDLVVDILDVIEVAIDIQVGDNRLAALEAIHARIASASKFVHRAIAIHDVDLLKIVTLADKEVIRIVRRRNLDDARAELLLHVHVGDDGDLAARERQDDLLADEGREAFVRRVHRHGGIARQRLGARRRDHDVVDVQRPLHARRAAHHGVAHVPEVAVVGLVLHLVVRERRAAARTPVDDVVALVDEPFVEELREHLRHGLRAAFVEREALALPVRRVAEHALLVDDRAAVLPLPLPHALDERLAPEVLAALALLLECLLDDVLRRDPRVVRPRQPQRVEAAHPAPAHEDVLDRLVERVAHVQDARHVRRRNHDGIRRAMPRLVMEISVLLPDGIPFGLGGLGVVALVHHLVRPFLK